MSLHYYIIKNHYNTAPTLPASPTDLCLRMQHTVKTL